MYDHHFSNFGRPPVPNDLCKDSAPRHPRFWRFLKVFTIYGHGSHLGQWNMTILPIFCSPNQRRLHMKFVQNWLSGFRGELFWKCKRMDARTHIHTDGHLLGNTVLIFRLKIPNKTPKYPTSASNLLGTYFGHLRNKWQVPNLCLPNICPFVDLDGQTDGWTDDRQKVITIAHPEQSSGELKIFQYVVCWKFYPQC